MKRTLYFDEDSDARFYQFEAGTMTKFDLDAILENLSKTSVGVYIVGVNAQIANFRNSVFQSYLDGFDIRLGPYQPALRGDARHWSFRRRANMAVLEAQGIDSNAYLLAGARGLGMGAWIDVRMNDMHNGHDENSQIHTDFWRDHPELRIPGNIPCENGFDYSHACIRDMYSDFIVEAFETYRPDNVLLDWMRWPAHLPRETGPERAHLITDMLKKLRGRLGQPFACRVPVTPESALKLGLDVKSWVEEGVLSHLFVGNFGCGGNFDVPVERWRTIVGKLPVIVTLEEGWRREVKYRGAITTVEDARGLAAGAYWSGADGLQVFNCMKMLRPPLSSDLLKKGVDPSEQLAYIAKGRQIFNEVQDPDIVTSRPRRVHPGWDDCEIYLGDLDQCNRIPGYYENWLKTHKLPNGVFPASGETVWRLRIGKAPSGDARLFTDAEGKILVNGHETCGPEPILVPHAWLRDGVTEVKTFSKVTHLYMEL